MSFSRNQWWHPNGLLPGPLSHGLLSRPSSKAPTKYYFSIPTSHDLQHTQSVQNLGTPSSEPITFSVQGEAGVSLVDIKHGDVQLDSHDELVSYGEDREDATWAIQWPGYPQSYDPQEFKFFASEDYRDQTLQSLGFIVAHAVEIFMTWASSQQPDYGWESWTVGGRRGIHFEDVKIASFGCYDGVWVPELLVQRSGER